MTVAGRTHWLPRPFMVIATQNPYEQAGSPAARVAARPVPVQDPPGVRVRRDRAGNPEAPPNGLAPDVLGDVAPLLDISKLTSAQQDLDETPAPDDVIAFIVDVIRGTREADGVILGASRAPRCICWLPRRRMRVSVTARLCRGKTSSRWRRCLPHRLIVSGVEAEKVVAQAVEAALRLKRVDD